MFSINIKSAKEVYSELQSNLMEMNRIVNAIEEIGSIDASEKTYMPIKHFQEELENLREQRKVMLECVSVFRQLIELYEKVEISIVDYNESPISFQFGEVGWISTQYTEETRQFIERIKI